MTGADLSLLLPSNNSLDKELLSPLTDTTGGGGGGTGASTRGGRGGGGGALTWTGVAVSSMTGSTGTVICGGSGMTGVIGGSEMTTTGTSVTITCVSVAVGSAVTCGGSGMTGVT